MKITIVDYKVGNQKSLEVFFSSIGYETILSNKKKDIQSSEIIILPGIGAFPEAMKSMNKNSLTKIIKEKASHGTPIIGICLGMQLLATKSYEFGVTKGLNLIPGEIRMFDSNAFHIGWNNINKIHKGNNTEIWFSNEDSFFFNHSYYFKGSSKFIVAKADHKISIPSIIKKKNIYGIQFHPEKSQSAGKNLLINLLNYLTKKC